MKHPYYCLLSHYIVFYYKEESYSMLPHIICHCYLFSMNSGSKYCVCVWGGVYIM